MFTPANRSANEAVLMRAGQLVPPARGQRLVRGHLVIEDVKEENEGTYTVSNTTDSTVVKRLILVVRGELMFSARGLGGTVRFCRDAGFSSV